MPRPILSGYPDQTDLYTADVPWYDIGAMKFLYTFFRSTKLAIALILYIAGMSAIATFIPQGRGEAFYLARYAPIAARVILFTGFDRFFTGYLFIFPMVLFFTNLLVCSAGRLVEELRGRRKRFFGPDIIHLGMLLLIVASVFTASSRREMFLFAAEGDGIALPGGQTLTITSFDFITYEGGRPKDWITTVALRTEGGTEEHKIEVNRPLKVGDMKIYQSSWRDGEGGSLNTGLLIKKQRGFPLILGSFILVCLGLVVTYLRKLREDVV